MAEEKDFLVRYLQKLGYRQTARTLSNEAVQTQGSLELLAFELRTEQDASVSNYLVHGPSGSHDGLPNAYDQAYRRLRSWAETSLDAYREELYGVLYPVFVHAFLDLVGRGVKTEASGAFFAAFRADHEDGHGEEVERLGAIKDAVHLRDNPIAGHFRSTKYCLTLTVYAFQLLRSWLEEETLGSPWGQLLLKIVNQCIRFRIILKSRGEGGEVGGWEEDRASGMTTISWQAGLVDGGMEGPVFARWKQEIQATGKTAEQTQAILAGLRKTLPEQQGSNAKPLPERAATASEVAKHVAHLQQLSRRAILSTTCLPSVCAYRLHHVPASITSMDWSEDGLRLAVAHDSHVVDIWSVDGKESLARLRASVELAQLEASGQEKERAHREGSTWMRLVGHSQPVVATRMADHLTLTAGVDGCVRLWVEGSQTAVYRPLSPWPLWDLDMRGLYFAAGGADRTATVWRRDSIHPGRLMVGHRGDVEALRFHPNGVYLATGSLTDHTVRLWDVHTGSPVRLYSCKEGGGGGGRGRVGLSALAFSPDGRHLASNTGDGSIVLWDLSGGDGKPLKRLPHRGVTRLAFDRDGRILASGAMDGTVRVWEVGGPNTTPLAGYGSRINGIRALHFAPRNVLLAAGPSSQQ